MENLYQKTRPTETVHHIATNTKTIMFKYNGKLHRFDGPAVREIINNKVAYEAWYLCGILMKSIDYVGEVPFCRVANEEIEVSSASNFSNALKMNAKYYLTHSSLKEVEYYRDGKIKAIKIDRLNGWNSSYYYSCESLLCKEVQKHNNYSHVIYYYKGKMIHEVMTENLPSMSSPSMSSSLTSSSLPSSSLTSSFTSTSTYNLNGRLRHSYSKKGMYSSETLAGQFAMWQKKPDNDLILVELPMLDVSKKIEQKTMFNPNNNMVIQTAYYPNGQKAVEEFIYNGKYHREDGPAYIEYHSNGKKALEKWKMDGKIYRSGQEKNTDKCPVVVFYDENEVPIVQEFINGDGYIYIVNYLQIKSNLEIKSNRELIDLTQLEDSAMSV